jgi:hypothetical protein
MKKIVFSLCCIIFFLGFIHTTTAQRLLSEQELAGAKEYTSVETALAEADKVYKLSLIGIKTLPADIAKLPNLQVLILSGVQDADLKNILAQIANLPIQELYLRESQLTVLPAEIAKLKNLRQLDLSFNKYTTLPAEIGQCSKLQTLNLLENKFAPEEKDKVKKMLPNTNVLF